MDYNISNRLKNVSGNAIRELFDLLKDKSIISFAGGWPTTSTLPAKQIETIISGLISKYGTVQCLQYESTRGKSLLLEQLKSFLSEYKGINAEVENMIVVAGGQQGIEYMCKTFLNKNDVVLVQDPTYLSTLQIVRTYQGRSVGVKTCDDGLDLNDLEEKIIKHKPKFLYIVPTFSNPTGETYSETNRKGIAEITARYGVMVLEDDAYAEIRYEGKPVPPVKTFDKVGNIVYLNSFSKIISPALRIAVAVGDPQVIAKFIISKQSSDVCAPSINQLVVAEFLQENTLKKHLGEIVPVYKDKRDIMVECIRKYMPADFRFSVPRGGMFIWGHFDSGRDTLHDFHEMIKRKVAFLPGCHSFAAKRKSNAIRLNFSNATKEQIEEGIKKMGEYFSSSNAKRGTK